MPDFPEVLPDEIESVARTRIRKNSGATDVGRRRRLNFIEGSNVTLTLTDDPIGEEVDITIASTGGGGSDTPWSVDHDAGSFQLYSVGTLRIGTGSNASTTEIIAGSAATVSDGTSRTVGQFGGARTWDTTAGGSYTLLNSAVTVTATANMTNIFGLNFSPTKAGSGNLTTMTGAKVAPTCGLGTTTTFKGVEVLLTESLGTTTTAIGVDIDTVASLGGTITTGIGLRIGVGTGIGGSTAWGLQVGNFQSYHQGKLALGGTTAPTYGLHLQATGGDTGSIHLNEVTTTPTNPASSAGVVVYEKADKFVIAFNNAGTMRYFTCDLTQSGATATWAQSTSAP